MISHKIKNSANNNLNENAVFYQEHFYTYKDLISVSEKLSWLHGKKIVIAYDKSWEFVSIIFACFSNQITFIPVSLSHPDYRLANIIQDCDPDLVISPRPIMGSNVQTMQYQDLFLDLKKIDIKSEYIAYIIYTSGSTGEPKGVVVSDQGLENVIEHQIKTFSLNKTKMFFYVNTVFDASISDMLCAFLSGSCLYISENIKTKFTLFQDFLRKQEIEYIDLPPSVLKYLDLSTIPSLKNIVLGGEVPDFKLIRENVKYVNIFNVYGPTEASICTSIHKCTDSFNESNIGLPIPGIEYLIENNELFIGGKGLALKYTNTYLTKEKFIFKNGMRYFKTGDIVYLTDQGYIFNGRNDSQIKYRGQLINLEEISLAAKTIEGVKDAFAYFYKEIFLFVEGYDNDIKEQLKTMLPHYMIPKTVIACNNFSRNLSEKINKRKILENYDFYLAEQTEKMFSGLNIQSREIFGTKTLITGSNGFLGMHIAEKMSQQKQSLILLVRAETLTQAINKIKQKEKLYNIKLNWDLVEVAIGDCRHPMLGLNKDIRSNINRVIHCAAEVNNIKSYDQLFDSNVLSTKNIIEFCSRDIKLEFISTLSVFVSSCYNDIQTFSENQLTVSNRRLNSGYALTKWQSEYLINIFKQNGGNASIYRLGLLTESLNSSYLQNRSFLYLLLKELDKLQELPKIERPLYIDLSPVSMIAEDLVNIFSIKQQNTYNVSYNIKLSYKEIINFLNKKYLIDKDTWFDTNKNKLVSHFMSIENNNLNKKNNLNIFETTMVKYFNNDIFLRDSKRKEIPEQFIKDYYFNLWRKFL